MSEPVPGKQNETRTTEVIPLANAVSPLKDAKPDALLAQAMGTNAIAAPVGQMPAVSQTAQSPDGSITLTQNVSTHNSVNIKLGLDGLGIQARQSGSTQNAEGVRSALPEHSVSGHIPSHVLESGIADTFSASTGASVQDASVTGQQQILNINIVDPRPVTTAFNDDGELVRVNLPAGSPGTFQSVLALTAKGKPIYVPHDPAAPVSKGEKTILVQVNQGTTVSQSVKVSHSPYSKGNFGGLFAPDDENLWRNYLRYLRSREAITDTLNPVRVFRSSLQDTTQSLARTGRATSAAVSALGNVLKSNMELLHSDPVRQEFDDWRNARIHAGESEKDFETRMMMAPVISWCMVAMWGLWWVLLLWQWPQVQSSLARAAMCCAIVTLTATMLSSLWRAHQCSYRTFRSFGDWLRNPRWWLSRPVSDRQFLQAKRQQAPSGGEPNAAGG